MGEKIKLCKCGCGREVPSHRQYVAECQTRVNRERMVVYNREHRNCALDLRHARTVKLRTMKKCNNILHALDVTAAEISAQVEKIRLKHGVPYNFIQI